VTGFLAVPQVRRMLADRSPAFALGKLLDTEPGVVILVSLAVDRLHGAAHLVGGLFVSAFQNAVMARVDTPEKARVPAHLYVDEFETMATDRFGEMLAEGRRFGLGLTLAHQNLAQMPPALGQMVLSNAHAQLYFQTGAQDAALLAREVVPHPGESREVIRRRLTTQGVGEAYLLRRGQAEPTPRLRVLPCPDPDVPAARVAALRAAARAAYGARPAAEVDREIARRMAGDPDGASAPSGTGAAPGTAPPPAAATVAPPLAYEVRSGVATPAGGRMAGRYAPGGKGAATGGAAAKYGAGNGRKPKTPARAAERRAAG